MEGPKRLSDNVGFATLKESLPNSAASLMDYTRDTLRRAKDIAATLEEADRVAEEAWRRAEDILQETREYTGSLDPSDEERPGDVEAALVQNLEGQLMPRPTSPRDGKGAGGKPPGLSGAGLAPAAAAGGAAAHATKAGGAEFGPTSTTTPTVEPGPFGQGHKDGREGRVLAAEMREQITSSVMWVQQLLELVNTAEGPTAFTPGESLKKPSAASSLFGDEDKKKAKDQDGVDDKNLPKLKEMALSRCQEKYQEKKQDEQDDEDNLSVFFRSSALTSVAKAASGRRA